VIEPFSTDIFDQVKQFHEKFVPEKIAKWSDEPGIDSDEVSFRLGFLCEEMEELVAAIEAGDLAGELDAYLDIAWVALGTASYAFWLLGMRLRDARGVQSQHGESAHRRRVQNPAGRMDWARHRIVHRVEQEIEGGQ
jgi:hypothetical protein